MTAAQILMAAGGSAIVAGVIAAVAFFSSAAADRRAVQEPTGELDSVDDADTLANLYPVTQAPALTRIEETRIRAIERGLMTDPELSRLARRHVKGTS
ncbi:hypothetical protein GCM10027447_12780 [Glycomyces halotolerans]